MSKIMLMTAAATEKEKVAGSKSENRRRSDSKPELGEGGEVGRHLKHEL